MTIMVATPYRSATHPDLLDQWTENFDLLTYEDRTMALYRNDYGYSFDYSTNAKARNELIEKFLNRGIKDVLWIDIDITEIPDDLIERLLEYRSRTECQIVAPMIYIHRKDSEIDVFYDVGGFQQNGKWIASDCAEPPFDVNRDLDSVGSCYLIPAEIYRAGAKYAPHVSEYHHSYDPEHVSVMLFARKRGYRIRADQSTVVWHAWLPDYQMDWQKGTECPKL